MKKLIILAAALPVLSGCVGATVDITQTEEDILSCEANYFSLLKDIDKPHLNACGVEAGADSSVAKEIETLIPLIKELITK